MLRLSGIIYLNFLNCFSNTLKIIVSFRIILNVIRNVHFFLSQITFIHLKLN